eukprot:TRINITY_DN1006_c0_g1_i1.p1 TRINITY_DN1006_c0_g1~~TRINITY_DN1006_c0_g1_i1.p1  ORF type:complete len:273 (+),score=111.29 TRINITY_DN1006_c0_g1_i1:82-819(+)
MAFNRTDTRQRAYNRIDACNPQGNWIDEPSFNKQGRKGCLVGNWQEDATLQDDMGADAPTYRLKTHEGAGVERGAGGFNSSKFLVSPVEWDDKAMAKEHFASTNRLSHNAENSNTEAFKPAKLGARSEVKRQAVVAQALAEDAERKAEEERLKSQSHFQSTYQATTAQASAGYKPLATVRQEGQELNYAQDQPVTLYVGNPQSGSKMGVPGNTAGTGKVSHGRNCNFSTPIDKHPIGGKYKTPQF